MSAQAPVDLVVGIDFGMTYTGVAYSKTKLPTPRVIQKWPGRLLHLENKVPSSLVYWPEGHLSQNIVKNWGFKSQNVEGTKEWFKQSLDPKRINGLKETARKRRAEGGAGALQVPYIPDHDEVKKYYKDYMHCLYNHLSEVIQEKAGNWRSQRVEFIFSLPCTFQNHGIGRSLLTLIKEAGFGTGGERHTIELGLTEPEAAAVFTIRDSALRLRAGDTILVCDAGGGTTDLALLQSVTRDEDVPELEALNVVEGKNVGSTNIDTAFEKMVENRISAVNPKLLDNTAWSMMHSPEFLAWKCIFGQDDSQHYTSFQIPVPTVESDFNHHEARIKDGKMHFTQRDFRDLFDPEIEELITLISAQIRFLERSYRDRQLDYIVLSGGLGSSPYVKSRLKAKFEGGGDQPELQVLASEEPQLAVVKGLVIDRIQKLSTGKSVLKSRKCRASYGVELSIPYEKEKHLGQDVIRGHDGVTYARGQIIWLIRKGETVDPERPIIKPAHRDFLSDEKSRRIFSTIYMSWNDLGSLPTNTSHADATLVCHICFDLTNLGLDKLETRKGPSGKFYKRDQKYYRAVFETKIIIGAADFKIEVWFRGKQYGEKYVSVDWA